MVAKRFIRVLFILALTYLPSGISHAQPSIPIPLTRGTLNSGAWNPMRSIIAAGGSHGIWLYDAQARLIGNFLSGVSIQDVEWSADGKMLAVQYEDNRWSMFAVDGASAVPCLEYLQPFESFEWNADGSRLFVRSGAQLYIFAYDGNFTLLKFLSKVRDQAWSWDGDTLAITSEGQILLLEAESMHTSRVIRERINGFRQIAWNSSGTRLAAVMDVSSNCLNLPQIMVFDTRTGERITSLSNPKIENPYAAGKCVSHTPTHTRNAVLRVFWMQREDLLVVESATNSRAILEVWNIDSGVQVAVHPRGFISTVGEELGYLPDGSLLYFYVGSSSYDSHVLPADGITPSLTNEWETGWFAVNSTNDIVARFSVRDNQISLFDGISMRRLISWNTHASRTRNISWSNDGKQLVVISGDELQIYDVDGTLVANTLDHSGSSGFLENAIIGWDTTGRYLALLSNAFGPRPEYIHGSIRIWDRVEERYTVVLRDFNHVLSARWSTEGRVVVSDTLGTTVWNGMTGELLWKSTPTYGRPNTGEVFDNLISFVDGQYSYPVWNFDHSAFAVIEPDGQIAVHLVVSTFSEE